MSHTAETPVVCVGASWGGMAALARLLAPLPRDLPAAICIVQHRPDEPGMGIVESLRRTTALHVCEPDDKQPISAGTAYVAPAGYHLQVDDEHLSLSVEDRVRWARPSVDVLFESVAVARGPSAIGVVLTGANDDGARGSRAIVDAGGVVLVQDPDEAERSEMPRAAIAACHLAAVIGVDAIPHELIRRLAVQA